MLPLFLAICFIVIGLGVVVPLLPFNAVAFGATPSDVARLFATYSGCQFLAAPARRLCFACRNGRGTPRETLPGRE